MQPQYQAGSAFSIHAADGGASGEREMKAWQWFIARVASPYVSCVDFLDCPCVLADGSVGGGAAPLRRRQRGGAAAVSAVAVALLTTALVAAIALSSDSAKLISLLASTQQLPVSSMLLLPVFCPFCVIVSSPTRSFSFDMCANVYAASCGKHYQNRLSVGY